MSKRESIEPPCRLLIVEDDGLISEMIQDQVAELNLEIAGVAASVAGALRLIETVELDAALLDMKLHEGFSGDVADALVAHGIPFLFVSGYAKAPDPRHEAVPILLKPFDIAELKKAVEGVLPQKCLPGSHAAGESAGYSTMG
jgi:CheY-like chemotaxis protein